MNCLEKDGIYIVSNGQKTRIEKELPSHCEVKIRLVNHKAIHATVKESIKI